MISLVSMSRILIKLLCSIPPKFDNLQAMKNLMLNTFFLNNTQGNFCVALRNFNRHYNIFVKIKTGKRTRGHDFTVVKWQIRLDV